MGENGVKKESKEKCNKLADFYCYYFTQGSWQNISIHIRSNCPGSHGCNIIGSYFIAHKSPGRKLASDVFSPQTFWKPKYLVRNGTPVEVLFESVREISS